MESLMTPLSRYTVVLRIVPTRNDGIFTTSFAQRHTHVHTRARAGLTANNVKDERISISCCLNDALINNASHMLHMYSDISSCRALVWVKAGWIYQRFFFPPLTPAPSPVWPPIRMQHRRDSLRGPDCPGVVLLCVPCIMMFFTCTFSF